MKEQNKIPTSKVQRASRFLKTGVKVGSNYVKYAAKSIVSETSKADLDKKNADEIFELLNQLKGSALKVAQMMSLDTGLLPKEYAEKFAQAQNNAMALSGPLITNTFVKQFGKAPNAIYDEFNATAKHAASIGQVHEAYKDGKKLAVKIQYPGVADAIHNDINMVKPLAARLIGVPTSFLDYYAEEFEARLTEECNYNLELQNGLAVAELCKSLNNVVIPNYYTALSSDRVLTMDWIEGKALQDFINSDVDQAVKDKIGQTLVDFVFHQIHYAKRFHADPHPGNFLVTADDKLVVLDFGCMKSISEDFYKTYFSLADEAIQQDEAKIKTQLIKLDMLRADDSEADMQLFYSTAKNLINLITEPLKHESFYFGDEAYTNKLNQEGESMSSNKEFRKPKAIRGNRDAIYLHRTFFGMYAILYQLKATVKMDKQFLKDLTN